MPIKIMLDPGHGQGSGFNRGSIIGNEGDNNYAYYLVLRKELESYGFLVGTTRKSISENPGLSQRGKMAKGYDLFISLHSNAGNRTVRGTEIWNGVARPFPGADGLCKEISNVFGHRNRGVKKRTLNNGRDWYGVLRSNRAKFGMLIEHGFHTNNEDCKIYVTKREEIARATSNYLARYFGLTKKHIRTELNVESKVLMENKKYVVSYILDGDLANAQALFNVLGDKAVLTKGNPGNVNGKIVIQVGGEKQSWANLYLSGKNRAETLLSVARFLKEK